jgi:hypothetical protein
MGSEGRRWNNQLGFPFGWRCFGRRNLGLAGLVQGNVPERMSRFVNALIPLLAGGSVFLVRWLLSPYFVHKELKRQIKGKPRQEILSKITDEFHRVQIPGDPRYDWIGLLVKYSCDFGDWQDLDWVCCKLSEQHSDPFYFFSVKYTPKSFGKEKRFKFINDARTAYFGGHPIFTGDDAKNYMEAVWADENKLVTTKERTLKSLFVEN